ncbi:MAG TPA: aminotransferase class IV [Nostocaceae cyanobacterium]|nr:aminotransferase class IV [Nostocaceae cyanobacterium]
MTIYWYQGQLIESPTIELDIYDPGFLYGATVFTTLRVYHSSLDHSLTNWTAHCDRLQSSLQAFNWVQPDWLNVRQGVEMVAKYYPVLRITLFGDGRELIIGRNLPPDLAALQQHGVTTVVASPEFTRSLPNHKTGNYLSPLLAKSSIPGITAQEGILVDGEGNWLETCTGNLWGWRDGYWWTPPLEVGILPGIMRSQMIKWLETEQIKVKQEAWTKELVTGFEAIAYSNSVVEIIPIHTVHQPTGSLRYNPYHPTLSQLRNFFPA